DRAFKVEAVHVVTMQALSGAGYPGVASLDILDNVLPSIDMGGEDRKIEIEPLKILGKWSDGRFVDAPMRISAMTHRVNVRDGHLEAVSVKLGRKASREEVEAAIRNFTSPIDELQLPSAPRPVMVLETHVQRPQPRLDRDRGQGMTIVVGPISPCAVLDYKFRVLSHNKIRGAPGAGILALRPEFTSLVAKTVATRLASLPKPIRLYYSGEVLRFEKPKGGRQREFAQVGIEHYGGTGKSADVEILLIAVETLQRLGIQNFQINLGSVDFFGGIVDRMELPNDQIDSLKDVQS